MLSFFELSPRRMEESRELQNLQFRIIIPFEGLCISSTYMSYRKSRKCVVSILMIPLPCSSLHSVCKTSSAGLCSSLRKIPWTSRHCSSLRKISSLAFLTFRCSLIYPRLPHTPTGWRSSRGFEDISFMTLGRN